MNLSPVALALWMAGFVEHAVLLLVLLMRGRQKTFPIFTIWIGFMTVRTILLFVIYSYGSARLYRNVYWPAAFLEVAIQIGVVFEIARIVLKPTGTWVHDARRMFLLFGGIGAVIAAAISYAIHPNASSSLSLWLERGDLFSIMLTVEMFVSMTLAASHLGLVWNHHVMRIGQGLGVWSIVALFIEGAASHFGRNWHGIALDNIRIVTYQAVTVFWIIYLWLPEPERRTLSPEMQKYLLNLQTELQGISNIGKH